MQPLALLLAPSRAGAGHGLTLQGIHARQTADATLIEDHSGAGFGTGGIGGIEFSKAIEQPGTDPGGLGFRH